MLTKKGGAKRLPKVLNIRVLQAPTRRTNQLLATDQAALNILCGSMTNFFGTPASNSP